MTSGWKRSVWGEHLCLSRARRFRPPPSRSAPLSAGSTSARLVPSPAASLSSQSSTARTAPSAPTIFKVHRAGPGREPLKPVGGQGPETAEAAPARFNGFGRHAGTRSSESALRPPRARRRPGAVQARPASPGLSATDSSGFCCFLLTLGVSCFCSALSTCVLRRFRATRARSAILVVLGGGPVDVLFEGARLARSLTTTRGRVSPRKGHRSVPSYP